MGLLRLLLAVPWLLLFIPQLLWVGILGKENYYNCQGRGWGFWRQLLWVMKGKPPL
jgi:hypothetical protein